MNIKGERQFHSVDGNWDAVFIDTDAAVPTWRTEPVVGWMVFIPDDDSVDFDVVPVLGGETVEVNDEWIGIYRTADLVDVDVQRRLLDLCESAFLLRKTTRDGISTNAVRI